MKKVFLFILAGMFAVPVFSQALRGGPYIGHATPSQMSFVLLVDTAQKWSLELNPPQGQSLIFQYPGWQKTGVTVVRLMGLIPGTQYTFTGKNPEGKELFSFRASTLAETPSDSFSFVLGSCAYIGAGVQGLVPAGSSNIYSHIAGVDAAFMVWLGDNTYYLGNEFNSIEGMIRKQIKVHTNPHMNQLLGTRPNYAIWDDHDYGPNDSDGRWRGKAKALRVFNTFWQNPGSGTEETPGVFFKFSYGDCEFFMCDDRYHRDDSAHSQMLGPGQMEWLMNGLRNSKATFKFIAIGCEVLNNISKHESWELFAERKQFMDFIEKEKISGILFLTGDRHFTELLKLDRPGAYPLYDFTCSPLSSWVRKVSGIDNEANNPLRVPGTHVLDQNYGKITVSGPKGNRQLHLQDFDAKGRLQWEKVISEGELR